MNNTNAFGLSRHIPAEVKREVRSRCKFGCVICRCGLYQYEHIEPPFEEARIHDPDKICCLCGSCHDSVTRGQHSKSSVASAYRKIQNPSHKVQAPKGPLDFNSGTAELQFGNLLYSPAVNVIFRYHGMDVIRVDPSNVEGQPGTISAIFTDDDGKETLRLQQNEWIGSLENWDIEITGRRIRIRRHGKHLCLVLRLDPPGKIVIEHLDMRFGDAHLLVNEKIYAVGKVSGSAIYWVHSAIKITRSSPLSSAIEFTPPGVLELRERALAHTGKGMESIDKHIIFNSNTGLLVKPLGICIAGLCGGFQLGSVVVGKQNLDVMRAAMKRSPDKVLDAIYPTPIPEQR